MAVRRVEKMDRRDFEDPNMGSGTPLKVFAAVALFGLAFLLIYITVVPPQAGTAMAAIQNVLFGLGGNLAPALPLALAWASPLVMPAPSPAANRFGIFVSRRLSRSSREL